MAHNTVDPAKLFSVKGIVVVITGGGTGIGLDFTKAFAQNGAKRVYIVGRRKDKLDEAVKIASVDGNVVPLVGDVTSKESLLSLADHVKKDVGYVNLVISNSGYMPPRIELRAMQSKGASFDDLADKCLQQDPSEWNLGFATNTTAVAFTTFAFLRLLHAGNQPSNRFSPTVRSQVLVTTSIAGFLRNMEAYNASKAATTALVKSLASNFAPHSIRVNAIAPGLFPTDLSTGLFDESKDLTAEGAFESSFIPAQRLGTTSDLAGFVLYAASQAGAYLNGNIQVVDGGRVANLPGTY